MIKIRSTKKIPYWDPEWTKLEGQLILQIKGSKYAAIPNSGKKNSSRFVAFNIDEKEELTQLKKSEVNNWLIKMAKEENVKPTGYI